MSIQHIYRLILALLSVGLLISSLEYIVKINVFAPNGLLSWNVMQLRWGYRLRQGWVGAVLRGLFAKTGLTALFLLRVVCLVLALIAPTGSGVQWLFLGLVTGSLLLTTVITFYGSDGSDQMATIILITFFLCWTPFATPTLLQMGLWFIALQACLSYSIAGVAKLVSAEWRGGTAVYDIFSTKSYGARWASDALRNRPWLQLLLCWSVILAESLFPLALVLPGPFALVFLCWGFLFHFLNAVIMGLNSFFWAFLATYPAILFANHQLTASF